MREATSLLGTYPHTEPLKTGAVAPALISLTFVERDPVNTGFDEMIRDQAFDVCELAIGALFQAVAAGSPIRLLPVVTLGGHHHASLVHDTTRGTRRVEDLPGGRVAVRSFSQTTGMWVRAILDEEYGIRADDVAWVVTERSHLAGFRDPDNVELAPAGETVASLLASGTVDAAIMFAGRPGGRVKSLIADVEARDADWQTRHGFTPINHMVAVSGAIADDPAAVADLMDAFARAQRLAPEDSSTAVAPAEIVAALDYAVGAALRQGLIPEALRADELFAAGIDTGAYASGS